MINQDLIKDQISNAFNDNLKISSFKISDEMGIFIQFDDHGLFIELNGIDDDSWYPLDSFYLIETNNGINVSDLETIDYLKLSKVLNAMIKECLNDFNN